MSSRFRLLSRRLLPGAIALALGSGAAAFALFRERRRASAEAFAAINGEEHTLESSAGYAIEVDPSLGKAYGARALAEVQLGRLDAARDDLARADECDWTRRARAWLALREGRLREAFAALAGVAHAGDDRERFEFVEGGSVAPNPTLCGALFYAENSRAPETEEWLERYWPDDRTLETTFTRLWLARARTFELDDAGAASLLAPLLEGTPLDRGLALAASADLARVRGETVAWPATAIAREPTPNEKIWDRKIAERAVDQASFELERHRLLGKSEDLERALARLRRVLALFPTDELAARLLLRGLARSPGHESEAWGLARVLGERPGLALAGGRALWAIGDTAGACELASRAGARGEREAFERLVASAFDVELERPASTARLDDLAPTTRRKDARDRERIDRAGRAWLRERPWEAAADLDALWAGAPAGEMAWPRGVAHVRDDPALATVLLAPAIRSTIALLSPALDVLARELEGNAAETAQALVARGTSPAETPALENALWSRLDRLARAGIR